ncbi:MAG: hypothetical protein AMS15_00825 [Planctomycetes bacterium DG_23]|nr:MAG: hypothetical protein AMS15_00825 [Planctomycetes bacterium DG_23]
MRTLLINAPTFGSHFYSAPLGLGYIAACLEKDAKAVEILDADLSGNWQRLRREVLRREFQVAGISTMTHNFYDALALARLIKAKDPKITVVLGGVHPTCLPEETAREKDVDFVIVGEGESSLPALLEALEGKKSLEEIPGLCFERDGQIHLRKQELIGNLDSLPFPAYHLLHLERYGQAPHGAYFRQAPFVTMLTSRGCPFRCAFCANSVLTGGKWRARSPENVLDEIEYLVKEWGVREIHFEDDNLTLDRKRVIAICKGIIERGLKIWWKCPDGVHIGTLDEEVLVWMHKAGCYSLAFGIESVNERILHNIHKEVNREKVRRVVKCAKELGIYTVGFFIFGLPGETPRTVRETINFAKETDLDSAQFNLCVPFPGTEIFDLYKKKGYIKVDDLRKYDVDHVLVELEGLSAQALASWRRRAFLEFYLRFGVLWRNFRQITSTRVIASLFRRLRHIAWG